MEGVAEKLKEGTLIFLGSLYLIKKKKFEISVSLN